MADKTDKTDKADKVPDKTDKVPHKVLNIGDEQGSKATSHQDQGKLFQIPEVLQYTSS